MFFFFLLLSQVGFAQKLKKADKALMQNLKTHIAYLADDKLEGRRAGSNGEKLASDYIIAQFKTAGLSPAGLSGGYLQPFDIVEGKQFLPTTLFHINQHEMLAGKDFFRSRTVLTAADLRPWFLLHLPKQASHGLKTSEISCLTIRITRILICNRNSEMK